MTTSNSIPDASRSPGYSSADKVETGHHARPELLQRLQSNLRGEVLFDDATCAQYATDASVYQMVPHGVVLPADEDDITTCIEIAQEHDLPLLPRGGGTSQNGQAVNAALVLDNTAHFSQLLELDVENRRCRVQPGMVLDSLNRLLKPHGLWFPVDVSTASRATIGGMTGNNSCGQRSLVYGTMRHNVMSLDALLADGSARHFGSIKSHKPVIDGSPSQQQEQAQLHDQLLRIGARDADEITRRFPDVLRRVGGYNLDALVPGTEGGEINLAHLMVGSEGTLGYTTAVELKLAPIPQQRVLGVCHFPGFYQAMDAAQHLVELQPSAVELIDSTMIKLARDIDVFRPIVESFVQGDPAALLLVEFAGETHEENLQSLARLSQCMSDLGFNWKGSGLAWGGVVDAVSSELQSAIGEVRKSGLNIMMSMKTEGKPVSFVEDCAVDLPHLAQYTSELTELFEEYGTKGTWYAHASVGCLHVRPVLNLKQDKDLATMREIADRAFDLVLKYKGSHSGEHGDGISRSEFHPKMFGQRLVDSFAEVKQLFDPDGLFNPGKITSPPRMNERHLLRFHQDYREAQVPVKLDWSSWPEAAHGLQGAVEMCNNNGACRKLKGGAMCPSYRVTRRENDVTRGRANTLRMALSGQLPALHNGRQLRDDDALASDALHESMKLCVSCKACKRECPTGVDMARMKLEVLAARQRAGKSGLHERLVAYLPRYAPLLSRFPRLANLRNTITAKSPRLARTLEHITGFASERQLPVFRGRAESNQEIQVSSVANSAIKDRPELPEVILWADTFNQYFEPHNLSAAIKVLNHAGYRVRFAAPANTSSTRPLCCGRTFLSAGMIEQAREELQRTLDSLLPAIDNGAVVVGLEPSCLLTLRDELQVLLPGDKAKRLSAAAFLFEEFLQRELQQERLQLSLKPLGKNLLLHGHCHQKAFNQMGAVEQVLGLIPDTSLETIESSCCGMAGSFGYHRDTSAVSRQMAELDLLPAIGKAPLDSILVADGTSCRHQIADLAGRKAQHVACILEQALDL